MFLLDTDHLSEIISGSVSGTGLQLRLEQLDQEVATSIVTYEEILRGWLAEIHHEPKPRHQVRAYQRLFDVLRTFQDWIVMEWDEACVESLDDLVRRRLHVKTMDLKIATIAIRNNATLLSRNLKDFQRVPGLVVQDWLP